jgi:hypothetical protein
VSAKKRQAPIERKAYTLAEAAAVAGVGLTVIKEACDRGDLIKRYPTSRPVILADDLESWLRSLPTERRSA